jgi:uncharacterized protein YjbI with pentapeptide repeats
METAAPRSDGLVVRGADANLEVAIDGVLAVARREVLLLASALQSDDRIMSLVAAGRLRWSLSCARDFAARSPFAMSRLRERFKQIEEAAGRWLPERPGFIEDTEHMRQVLMALSDPYLGHRTVCANNTLIAGLDLDDLPLTEMQFRGATVTQTTARRAKLESCDASGAVITRSCFDKASMRLCTFNDTEIQGCAFQNANVEGSQWRGTRISNVVAQGALLFHSDIRSAHFVDCDFRDADFQGFADSGTGGAVFTRCDLRRTNWHGRDLSDVSFVRCKLYGAFGNVYGLDAARLEAPDLSPDGDGGHIANRNELIRHWMLSGVN